jgi:hypothetical protein
VPGHAQVFLALAHYLIEDGCGYPDVAEAAHSEVVTVVDVHAHSLLDRGDLVDQAAVLVLEVRPGMVWIGVDKELFLAFGEADQVVVQGI